MVRRRRGPPLSEADAVDSCVANADAENADDDDEEEEDEEEDFATGKEGGP